MENSILEPEKVWDLPFTLVGEGLYKFLPNRRDHNALAIASANKNITAYVYLLRVRDTNYFKIGVSTNPKVRFQNIDSSMPFELDLLSIHLLKDAYKVEIGLNKKYKEYKAKKEWYSMPIDKAKEIMIYLHNLNVEQDASE